MAVKHNGRRSLLQCMHCQTNLTIRLCPSSRLLSSTTFRHQDPPLDQPSTSSVPLDSPLPPLSKPYTDPPKSSSTPQEKPLPDPTTAVRHREERLLQNAGLRPLGSRRLRAFLRSQPSSSPSTTTPFSLLPYQCFQEARKILIADRQQKLLQIEEQRRRIRKAVDTPAEAQGGEVAKKGRVVRMMKYLEKLKVLADINDPVIKKQFEDGLGDMSRPIFRHLADKKWRAYKRKIEMQRIEQMFIVPDVLPKLDPTVEVDVLFGRKFVQPGQFVESSKSEMEPRLSVQVFDQGERYISIVVVDPDVPDMEKDGFSSRAHYIATNIKVSPIDAKVPLSALSPTEQVILPWLPPFAQKGSPYHRLTLLVFEHKDNKPLDFNTLKTKYSKREGFDARTFIAKTRAQPVGAFMFRTVWDEGMQALMERHGIEGRDIELRRNPPEKLPYKKKDGARYRGWKGRS